MKTKSNLIWVNIVVELVLLFVLGALLGVVIVPNSTVSISDGFGNKVVPDGTARGIGFVVLSPMFLFVSYCFFCDVDEVNRG